ncbi:MAG: AhpC/TSA family protein [Duncaniella sp.]|nr:AhpC/TSA family protein [Duncaniella sp.]
MKKAFLLALSAGMLALSACDIKTQSNYSVTAEVVADRNNTMAYLLNWDNGEKIDSAIVTNGLARFSGHTSAPFIGRLIVDGARGPRFIVEKGAVTVSVDGEPSGTPMNDKLTSYAGDMKQLMEQYNSIDLNDSIQKSKASAIMEQYQAIPLKAYKENKGNTLGLYWFLQLAYEMNLEQIDAAVDADNSLIESKRVKSIRNSLLARDETSEGKRYKDFTVTYDGKEQKFSDYVKPGQYTLVDFWASWCGPCIRQTKVIKELYAKYKDAGLNVVGVAVWDEPANTLKAIQSHGLDWPCIINGQTLPTDLYGISSIPCILLINPDGIIVSRDKQDQALIDDVDMAMSIFEARSQAAVPVQHIANDTATLTVSDTEVIF